MSINAGARIWNAISSERFVQTYLNKIDRYGETREIKIARKVLCTRKICQALGLDAVLTCGILLGMELAEPAFGYIGEAFVRGFDPEFSVERLAVEQMSAVMADLVKETADEWRRQTWEDANAPDAMPGRAAAREATADIAILGHESARILDGLRHALVGTDASAEELLARMVHLAADVFDGYPTDGARSMALNIYKDRVIRMSAERKRLTEPDILPPQEPRPAKRKICVSEALAVLQAAQRYLAEDITRIPEAFRDALSEYDPQVMAAVYAVGMTEKALEKLVGEERKMAEFEGLTRFYRDQDLDYAQALAEVKAGRKRSHWIWYIFPQMRGLGYSERSNFYGIRSLEEAKEYLADPVLSSRLLEITEALLEQNDWVDHIFGHIDAQKVKSCMTLFSAAAEDPEQKALFDAVLEKHYKGERCRPTLRMLNGEDPWQ